MRYGLFLKKSDEVIAKTEANNIDEALMFFAKSKLLPPSKLLKIYRIKKL